MALKGIPAMRAQRDYLFHHPLWLERCRLPVCPSHVTLGRRYKALTPTLEAFTEICRHMEHRPTAETSPKKSFMKIKVCSKPRGPSGIKRIASTMRYPKACAGLIKLPRGRKAGITAGSMDTDSISPPPAGVSLSCFRCYPLTSMNATVLDTKKEKLIDRGTRCIVADNGYVDKKRATAFAESRRAFVDSQDDLR